MCWSHRLLGAATLTGRRWQGQFIPGYLLQDYRLAAAAHADVLHQVQRDNPELQHKDTEFTAKLLRRCHSTPQGKCPRGTQDSAAGRDLAGRLLWAMKFEKLHSSVEYNLSFKFSLNLSLWWLAAQTASPAGSPGVLCGGICNTPLCRFPAWHAHF